MFDVGKFEPGKKKRIRALTPPYIILITDTIKRSLQIKENAERNPLLVDDYAEILTSLYILLPPEARDAYIKRVKELGENRDMLISPVPKEISPLIFSLKECKRKYPEHPKKWLIRCNDMVKEVLDSLLQLMLESLHEMGVFYTYSEWFEGAEG